MLDRKTLFRKLLYPPPFLLLLLTVISAASLVLVFAKDLSEHPIAYAVYVLSFYTLTVVCIFCATVLPPHFKITKQKLYETALGNRYMTDAAFRTHISLYASLMMNLLYVGANVLSGCLFRSAWFGILAGYYLILAVMRFLIVRYIHRHPIGDNLLGEWKRSRLCAAVLTLINLVLSGAILMILYRGKGFVYNGILVYVMAMYTFYITTVAVVNIIRYRKLGSPIMTTAKIVTLAASLVSMLSLETAMLTAFGADTPLQTKQILIAATGAGISVVIVAMSGYMIVRSTKEIQSFKKENTNHEG